MPLETPNRINPLTVASKKTDNDLRVPSPEVSDDAPIGGESALGFTIDKKFRAPIVIAGVFLTAAGGPVVATLTGTAFIVGTAVLAGVTGVLALLGYHAKGQ